MSTTDWEQSVYESTYAKAYQALQKRKSEDAFFTTEGLQGILEHLYIQDGLDHYGRGRLQDLVLRATIDAHEALLAQWKNESSGAGQSL